MAHRDSIHFVGTVRCLCSLWTYLTRHDKAGHKNIPEGKILVFLASVPSGIGLQQRL